MNKLGYEIIIWFSKEDGCFLAEVPELPGCMADGESIAEVAKAIEENMQIWLEVNAERGFATPQPRGRRLMYA